MYMNGGTYNGAIHLFCPNMLIALSTVLVRCKTYKPVVQEAKCEFLYIIICVKIFVYISFLNTTSFVGKG